MIKQAGHTVWVAMRSRLWRCNVDQIREAVESESLGADLLRTIDAKELLRQTNPGPRAGAVDVQREGTPPDGAWDEPVHREERPATEAPILRRPPGDVLRPPRQEGIPEPAHDETGDAEIRPGNRERSRTPTRANSVAEPAGEPEVSSERSPSPSQGSRSSGVPTLDPIPEDEDVQPNSPSYLPESQPDPIAETSSSSSTSSRSSSASTSSSAARTAAAAAAATPAPREARRTASEEAEAKRRRLEQRAPSSSPTVRRTLAEDLPRGGRVRRQAGEIEEEQARAEREITRAVRDLARSSRRSRSPAGARGSAGAVLGEEADFFLYATDGPLDHASFVAAPRGANEVRMRSLSDEEREKFNRSDAKEWKSIIDSGAVEVLKGGAAEKVRRETPERVLDSRMVRRWKPGGGPHDPAVPKSRWCVSGHQDPDTGSMVCFSPTASAEALMLFLQTALNLGMTFDFADVKAAFTQSNPWTRSKGIVYVEPCEGTAADKGDLLRLRIPVYGLDDAPIEWFRTLTGHLRGQGWPGPFWSPAGT